MTPHNSGGERHDGVPIRDAACLILVDRSETQARLLMGRRHPAQVFLPDKWVFPGGRVEDDDRALAAMLAEASGILRASRFSSEAERTLVQIPFAVAAIRETFEETGHFLGQSTAEIIEGLPPAWKRIVELGLKPDFEKFRPLARAITPPGRPRRFDTWFFIADWHASNGLRGQPDGELLDLGWFTVRQVRGLDLPGITRLIVDDVATALEAVPSEGRPLIPFYFQDIDGYKRLLIDSSWPV